MTHREDHVPHALDPLADVAVAGEPLLLRARGDEALDHRVGDEPSAGEAGRPTACMRSGKSACACCRVATDAGAGARAASAYTPLYSKSLMLFLTTMPERQWNHTIRQWKAVIQQGKAVKGSDTTRKGSERQ